MNHINALVIILITTLAQIYDRFVDQNRSLDLG